MGKFKNKLKDRFKVELIKLDVEDKEIDYFYTKTLNIKKAFMLMQPLQKMFNTVDIEENEDKNEDEEITETKEQNISEALENFNIEETIEQLETMKDLLQETLYDEDGNKLIENKEDREDILDNIPLKVLNSLFTQSIEKSNLMQVLESKEVAKK